MNILCVAPERRAAEAIASALRRISPQVRLTWAQTLASALDWLRDNRNAQAVLVDSGAEDAHGPAFLEQIRTLGVTIPVAVVSTEHVEWVGAAVTAGKDAIRGQERQRAGLVEERLNRICTGLQQRLLELEADLGTVNERHVSGTAALTARLHEQDALHAESLTRSYAVCAELRDRVLQLEAALQSAEEQHERLMAESIAARGVVEARLSGAQTSHERAAADLAASTERCAALDKQLAEVTASRSLLNDRLAALEAIRQRIEARHAMQLTLLKTDLGNLKARHDAAVTENAAAEERLRATSTALKEARARIAELTIEFERTALRAAELDGALADATAARAAAEVQLAEAVSAHLRVEQRLESELESEASRSAALQDRLAEENAVRTTLEERLAEAARARQLADADHAQAVQSLSDRLVEMDTQRDRAVQRSASLESQLAEVVSAHDDAERHWKSELVAADEHLAHRESEFEAILAAEVAARVAAEQRLTDAETAHRDATQQAAAELAAAAARHADLEGRLSSEAETRSSLEERLVAAEHERQRADAEHAHAVELLTTQLADLQAQHDSALTHSASIEAQLADTVAAHLHEQQQWASQLEAAAEQSAYRDSQHQATLALELATRIAVEHRLADEEAAHQRMRQQAAAELADSEIRQAELEERLAAEIEARRALAEQLATTQVARERADAEHAGAVESLSSDLAGLRAQHENALEHTARLESELTDAVASHQLSQQAWESERVAAETRSGELEERLAAEIEARRALAEQLAATQVARERADADHAQAMESLNSELTDVRTQHARALEHSASVESQLNAAVETHQLAQQEWESARSAAADRSSDLEARLAAEIDGSRALAERLAATESARERADAEHAQAVETLTLELAGTRAHYDRALEHIASVESQLAEAVTSHQVAQQHWDSERVAAAEHRADLERRLAEETAARITFEERLEASDHARQQAESDHTRAAEWLNTQLSDLRAEHDRALELTATLESQLTETATAHQHAQQHWEMELAAAAERLVRRESELGHALAEEAATRSEAERRLADVEDAHAQAQQQAAADRTAAAGRQADLERRLHHTAVAHATLEEQLAAAHADRHEADQRHVLELTSLNGQLVDLQARHDALVNDIEQLREDRDGVRRQLSVMQRHASALRHHAERAAQLQLQLAESQKEVRRQFERAPYGLFECTRDAEIIRVNNVLARLLGYRSADLPRADFVATLFECSADLRWLLERVVPAGNVQSIETTLRTRDRRRLSVCLHSLTNGGTVVIAVEDLTKLSALEQRVRDAQRLEAVGRVASEVAVTCDTLLRDVTQGGQRWLAAFESETSLRQQGELLLGDVTRAAGLLRQFAVYGHTQLTNVEPVSVQRVLHEMKPVLERVLGDDVELTLPKMTRTIGTFDVDVEASRVERILVNVANYARQRMPQGGQVKIHLATTVVDRRFLARHPKVRPGGHVLITISQVLGITRPALPVPWPAADVQGPATLSAMEKPGMDLGPLMALIGDLGGHLWMSVEPAGNVTLQIHLPRRTQDAAIETAVPGPLASRGRQLAKWFRH